MTAQNSCVSTTATVRSRLLALAAAVSLACCPAYAEPEMSVRDVDGPLTGQLPPDVAAQYEWPRELPTPREVFERHVEACGGADVFENQKTRLIRGTVVNDATGYRAVLNTFQESPDKIWMEFRQPGVGKQTIVFNGEIAWLINDAGNGTLLAGPILRDLQVSADFFGDARWEDKYAFLETLDFGVVENERVARVAYRTAIGKEGVHAFSLDTGRLVATQTYSAGAQGDELMLIVLDEYQDAGGYQIPTRIIQRTSTGLTETRYRQVLVDAEQPERVSFEPPPEVAEQLEEALERRKNAGEESQEQEQQEEQKEDQSDG